MLDLSENEEEEQCGVVLQVCCEHRLVDSASEIINN
jgi:hypothetical protein